MAKPPQALPEVVQEKLKAERLRIRYTEKVFPYNSGEEATWPANHARRAVILGVATACGFPGEDFPEDGGPQWSLSDIEEDRRRVLAVSRAEETSSEAAIDEQVRQAHAEAETKRRQQAIQEQKAVDDNEDVVPQKKARKKVGGGFLRGRRGEKAQKKTA